MEHQLESISERAVKKEEEYQITTQEVIERDHPSEEFAIIPFNDDSRSWKA